MAVPTDEFTRVEPFVVTPSCPVSGIAVLRVSGELDLATSPMFDSAIDRALTRSRVDQVIVDLSRVSFCAVTGITSLLRARTMAEQTRIGLSLATGPVLARVLCLLELRDQFDGHPDLPTALTAAGAASQRRSSPARVVRIWAGTGKSLTATAAPGPRTPGERASLHHNEVTCHDTARPPADS